VGNISAFNANYRSLGFLVDFGDGDHDASATVPVGYGTGKFKHIGLVGFENIKYHALDYRH
jgi:hypothetical protein